MVKFKCSKGHVVRGTIYICCTPAESRQRVIDRKCQRCKSKRNRKENS